jgi:hypothetical protein
MKNPLITLLAAALFAVPVLQAQQSQITQPPQTQAAPVPCTPVATPVNAADTGSLIKPTTQSQQAIAKWRKKLSEKVGIDLPDPTQIAKAKKTLPPCQPAQQSTQPAAVSRPPADASITLRCNPLLTPAKGVPGATSGFILPDPHQYETPPQANIFEADSAAPDVNAKTPCYSLKVDPKTNKYFIAQ